MVHERMKLKIALAVPLFLISLAPRAFAEKLTLLWQGEKGPECRALVGKFLDELKTMSNDRTIELDMEESAREANVLPGSAGENAKVLLRCGGDAPGGSPNLIETSDENEATMRIHYLGKTAGFDSLDWLPFQKKFLRPRLSAANLAPQPGAAGVFDRSAAGTTSLHVETPLESRHRDVILAGIIGGAAGATGGAILSPDNESRGMNMLVFGLTGALIGSALKAISR
ncbi:MAG: hypothetical protein HYW49_09520 [Deltaproteobacteria bacterium]|nr:hypothetical protein [Deltaproteobacteria bacterium]